MFICDRAGAFRSELMKRVCELADTKINVTVAYHAQSHGLVEHTQQTLLKMMKAYVQDFGRGWDEAIPFILLAYRSTTHDSLGRFNPSEVVYGKNLCEPLDLLRADWEGTVQSSSVPVADFVYNLQMKLKAIQEVAKENLQQAQAKQIFFHDLKSRHREFEI